jgi:hypothetical protein
LGGRALTAFVNALAVSLLSLVPGHKIGPAALVMAIVGLVFVLAALLSLVRWRQVRLGGWHDVLFLLGLILVFVFQFIEGADVIAHPGDAGSVNTIAILVVVCALIGIARSWELIGGPSIGITHEVMALVRHQQPDAGDQPGSGGQARHGGPGVRRPAGTRRVLSPIRLGKVDGYRGPGWPDSTAPKRYHLDVEVDDMAEAVRRCLELGAGQLSAVRPDFQPRGIGGPCSPTPPGTRSACVPHEPPDSTRPRRGAGRVAQR